MDFLEKPKEDYYKLLGCDELSSSEQIQKEYKIRALQFHPDKNPSPDAQQYFAQLQRAKEVLTDPSLRFTYDQWKRSGLAISFEEWLSKRETMNTSLHWATTGPKKPMIESNHPSRCSTDISWKQNPVQKSGNVIQMFRKYQI